LGSITVSEAGRKGGLTLLAMRGSKHFAKIGRKGQEVLRKRYPEMASVWGKKATVLKVKSTDRLVEE